MANLALRGQEIHNVKFITQRVFNLVYGVMIEFQSGHSGLLEKRNICGRILSENMQNVLCEVKNCI